MPGAKRATAPASTDNATACAMIKEQNKLALATSSLTVAVDDMSKAQTDDQIFCACASPEDELEEAAGGDLDSFELNYLHQLYTMPDEGMMMMGADAILPDAVAPPSLGMSAQVHAALRPDSPPSSSRSTMSHHMTDEDDHDEISQPSTPPRSENCDDSHWATEPEASPVSAPSGRQQKTSGRKRKASTLRGSPAPAAPPAKQSRAAAAAAAREAKEAAAREAAALSDDDDDSDDDSMGNPTLDGLEIRPEDDPLGLFSRDPSTLTSEEQRLLKKQRRLLKNRESAQLSRHRKKMHLHSLEKMVEALKRDKHQLAQKVQALADDNERLRKQLVSVSA